MQTVSKGDAAHVYINRLLESPTAVDSILLTHRLGDKVGRQLALEKVMRWTPAVSDGQLGPKETGLFKVRGVAVEAGAGEQALLGAAPAGSSRGCGFVATELGEFLIVDLFVDQGQSLWVRNGC